MSGWERRHVYQDGYRYRGLPGRGMGLVRAVEHRDAAQIVVDGPGAGGDCQKLAIPGPLDGAEAVRHVHLDLFARDLFPAGHVQDLDDAIADGGALLHREIDVEVEEIIKELGLPTRGNRGGFRDLKDASRVMHVCARTCLCVRTRRSGKFTWKSSSPISCWWVEMTTT